MPASYGALGLLAPVGADFPSEYRLSITQHAQLLGGAILYSTGTLSARPAAPTVAPAVYKATDTGLTYWWNGTAWMRLVLAGAWIAGIIQTGWAADGSSGGAWARLIGDEVEFKIDVVNNSGSTVSYLSAMAAWPALPSAVTDGTISTALMVNSQGSGSLASVQYAGGGALLVNGVFNSVPNGAAIMGCGFRAPIVWP